MAGAMLSFGGLLSEVLQGGAAGLTASNPGIVKVLGGFVFPVGLVMSGIFHTPRCCLRLKAIFYS
jgi:formate/nitrite transporter FocA (FNT family)